VRVTSMATFSAPIARGIRSFRSCTQYAPCDWQFVWQFAADDECFRGHFPGHPVLPGVFLLEMAIRAAEYALEQAAMPRHQICSVSRLRFVNPILPGDTCVLRLHWATPGQIQIAFTKAGTNVAHGVIGIGEHDRGIVRKHTGSAPAIARDGALPVEVLPHRYPMLLVDGFAVDGCDKDRATAYKNITINEPCYRDVGHDTGAGELAYPPALIVESFAQGAGLLLSRRGFLTSGPSQPSLMLFGEFRDIQFGSDALPGDQLRHEVQLTSAGRHIAHLAGVSRVEDRIVASFGSLMAFSISAGAVSRGESSR